MKRILITGAGGSASANFIRSLKAAPERFYLVGTDCNKYYLQRAETDKRYLVPEANNSSYIKVINKIIGKEKIDFIYAQNDIEIEVLSENRKKLKAKYFFPNQKTVIICQNKFESYQKWKTAGLAQPITMLLKTNTDLKKAFRTIGKKIWIRAISGFGGNGSLPTSDYKQAKSWIDFKNGWGHFTAGEYLSPQSITWQSIWHKGKLIVAQSRKRLYWEFAKMSPSGITGVTGSAITVSDNTVNQMAQKAILAIDKNPHGIFSVDLTFDQNMVPNPTEINIGRFFTTHEFFTKVGLNMPYIFIKLAFNEEYPKLKMEINPLPENLVWIRGVDFLPILTSVEKIEEYEKELKKQTY